MPYRTLEGIRSALGAPKGAGWAYVIVAIALLAICGALVHVLIVQVRRRNRLRAVWRELGRKMSDRKLSPAERQLVCALAARQALWSPADVIEKVEAFEEAVERHLSGLTVPASRSGPVPNAAQVISGLRAKLGFETLPGAIYYSTREIAAGQPVRLRAADGGAAAEIEATVRGGREDLLELVGAPPSVTQLKGRRVRAVFYRANGAYGFESSVVDVDPAQGSCLLAHSLDVVPAGLREQHRVTIGRPVAFRASWEKPEVRREGLLCDLSAGGLALRCPCYYETGEQLLIAIAPVQYLPPAGEHAEPPPEDRQIAGLILETRHTADGRCIYHVEFRDIGDEDRAYLVGLVRRIERESSA